MYYFIEKIRLPDLGIGSFRVAVNLDSTKTAVVLSVNIRCTRAAMGQTLKPRLWTQ